MINMPLTPDSVRAETAYRLERAKRDYRAANRRKRTAKETERPDARPALRPRPAA
ncbi:hypothetical protein [Kribbella sp. NPDC004536]|uniref:hypothetical protein n=1 Tax=Kribbella sp. NPDC004536 TaxID=3364106 RepID=UPI0036949AC6